MTWYAVNGESRQLICAWPSGRGYLARTVARWGSGDSQSPVSLADKLSSFSDQLWSCYAAAGATEPDCEAPRPALDEAFALIGQRPPAPTWLCRKAMLDATAQLARAMDRTTQDSVRAAVTKDIGEEIDAVARARAGDLTGRASQALMLSPLSTSTRQLRIAEAILHRQLLRAAGLLEFVEPTAAATATCVWLQAASLVAASVSGLTCREVFERADTIEPMPVELSATVVELLEAGTAPHTLVSDLLGDAHVARHGQIPRLDALEQAIMRAKRHAEPFRHIHPRIFAAIRSDVRVCLLDPLLPAPKLRADLMTAIRGCWLVYRDHRSAPQTGSPSRTKPAQGRFTEAVHKRRAQLTSW